MYAFCVSTWLKSQHWVDLFSILDYIFSHGYNCFLILSNILGNHSFSHLQAYSLVIGQPVLLSLTRLNEIRDVWTIFPSGAWGPLLSSDTWYEIHSVLWGWDSCLLVDCWKGLLCTVEGLQFPLCGFSVPSPFSFRTLCIGLGSLDSAFSWLINDSVISNQL